jgi:hypothetical protein
MDYFNSLDKNQKMMVGGVVAIILIAIIASSMKKDESFALPAGFITDKTQLDPTRFYRKGTIKQGVTSTQQVAYNNGATCTEYPTTVYMPVTNAVCDVFAGAANNFLDSRNIKAYVPVDESQETCGFERGTKIMTKRAGTTAADRTAFNNAVTTTPAQGGLDCFAQYYASLPQTQEFACTSNINSVCTFTDLNTYKIEMDGSPFNAESRDKCPNNQKTVSLRAAEAINATVANGGATVRTAINNGKTCAQQIADNTTAYPAFKTVPCTSAIDAVCSPQTANVEDNYTISLLDANVKSGDQWKREPFGQEFMRAQERFRMLERYHKERFSF